MTRPILLWMTSRSRSSMVSAIFAAHGIFWGERQVKSAGYDTYENNNIKILQKEFKPLWGSAHMRAVDANPEIFELFHDRIKQIVPSDQIWSMKTGIEYYPAYSGLNPFNVFITRKPEDVANSICQKRKDADYKYSLEVTLWRFNYMKQLAAKDGGVFVDTDKIIAGDMSEIQQAIEYCNLTYHKEAAKMAITK